MKQSIALKYLKENFDLAQWPIVLAVVSKCLIDALECFAGRHLWEGLWHLVLMAVILRLFDKIEKL